MTSAIQCEKQKKINEAVRLLKTEGFTVKPPKKKKTQPVILCQHLTVRRVLELIDVTNGDTLIDIASRYEISPSVAKKDVVTAFKFIGGIERLVPPEHERNQIAYYRINKDAVLRLAYEWLKANQDNYEFPAKQRDFIRSMLCELNKKAEKKRGGLRMIGGRFVFAN